MINKILEVLSSLRFWQLVIATVFYYCGTIDIISPELANAIATFLGVSVTIRTVDGLKK